LTSESDGVYTEDSLTNKEVGDSAEEDITVSQPASNYSSGIRRFQKHQGSSQRKSVDGATCDSHINAVLENNTNDSGRESELPGSGIDEPEQVLHERTLIPDEERMSNMDGLNMNGYVNIGNGDSSASRNGKHKARKNKGASSSPEISNGSESDHRTYSRSPSETRDMEQQTDVSWVEETHLFPVHRHTEDHSLTVSPVSVWTSGEKGLAVYGPHGPHVHTSSAESSPLKRKKKAKSVRLEISPPETWSTEMIDCHSSNNTITEPLSESDEDDCTCVIETEVYSPQNPSPSDKFFPDSTASSKPIRYHVTVNEESTNITYNIDRTEYKTYGLRSQIQNPDTVRIPETISINLSESTTEITDSRIESIRNEHINFRNGDLDPSHNSNSVISERRFQSVHDATREGNDTLERHFDDEMSACYLENRPNTSTPHPVNISVNSDDLVLKPESMLSPRESDTTSDYGTMIMDSKRGCMSFTFDSGDEGDSFACKSVTEDDYSGPTDALFSPTSELNHFSHGVSNVPAWLQVGTESLPQTEENAVESVSQEGQHLCSSKNSRTLHTIPSSTTTSEEVEHVSNVMLNSDDNTTQGEASNNSLSSEEEEFTIEETFILVDAAFESERSPINLNVADMSQYEKAPSTKITNENQKTGENIISDDEVNNIQDESSDSSIYRTPQQSPRNRDDTCNMELENVVIPDLPSTNTVSLPNLHLELKEEKPASSSSKSLKLKTASINTDTQPIPHVVRSRTVDDSVREELKRELQQQLARLQRHVRSLSDSAISSDYTDGDSTSVSPRGNRLYESDKTLRAGVFMEQRNSEDIEVMATQSEIQFNPSNGEPFLSAVAKLVDIDNKEPKKSPLKDSGNVFDDDEIGDQLEENIKPITVERNVCFPSENNHLGESMNNQQIQENCPIKAGDFKSKNSLHDDADSSLEKSSEAINNHDENRDYDSDLDYSDVLYTDGTSASHSFSPGEIYLDESTPEKMFRSIAMDAPSQESVYEDFETGIDHQSHHSSNKEFKDNRSSPRLHSSSKEKSPSMSDIYTGVERSDDVRRSYSENNIDEFEEDTNSESSNDSIVFVFMGQSHTKDSIEKLKNEGYDVEEKEDSNISSEQNLNMGNVISGSSSNGYADNSSISEDLVFKPIQDASSEHDTSKDYGQFESNSDQNISSIDEQELHHGVSCDSPLRHSFGIDASVLPIPERSVSADNLPKHTTSKQGIHYSRSASLLDVGSTDNPNDPSNNEGIFPPCVEDHDSSVGSREAYYNEEHLTHDTESITNAEDRNLGKLTSFEADSCVLENGYDGQELLYSSLPLENQGNREETTEQVDYNGNLSTKEQLVIRPHSLNPLSSERAARFISTGVQASLLDCETQTEVTDVSDTAVNARNDTQSQQHHVLPALTAPYRAQSLGDLGEPDRLAAMHFSEDTDNWQTTSTVAIETNALLSKINEKHPGMTSNSSLDESSKCTENGQTNSIQNSRLTQTGNSLTNLQDLEVQTDAFYFNLSLTHSTDSASTQTDNNITKPRVTSDTETNDYLPFGELVEFQESTTQTDSEEDSSSSSIQSDKINNVICRLSDALKNDNAVEDANKSHDDMIPTCYEKAKSPLKLRAGVKSITKVLTRKDGSSSDSETYDSNSNLAVDGKIVKEERHKKQHESKFSDEKTQTVITERECVVDMIDERNVLRNQMLKMKTFVKAFVINLSVWRILSLVHINYFLDTI